MRKEDAHSQARRLKSLLREEHGVTLSHGQAQHLTARSLGFSSWQEVHAQTRTPHQEAAPAPAGPAPLREPLSLAALRRQVTTYGQVSGVLTVDSAVMLDGTLDGFLTHLSERLTGHPNLLDVNYAFVGAADESTLLVRVTGDPREILEENEEFTTPEQVRALLPHLPPEHADAVLEYSLDGHRRYFTPLTAENLRDNADHLAEEEGWADVQRGTCAACGEAFISRADGQLTHASGNGPEDAALDEDHAPLPDSPEADTLANSAARNGPWDDEDEQSPPPGVQVFHGFGDRGAPTPGHPNSLELYRAPHGSDSMDLKATVQGDDPDAVRRHALTLLQAYHAEENLPWAPVATFHAQGTLNGVHVKLYRSNRLVRL